MGRKNAIYLCLAVTALVTLGLVMLTSTSVWDEEVDGYILVKKQSIWISLGLISAIAVSAYDYRKLRRWWVVFFVISCLLLVLCYIPGIAHEVKGESRWIRLPGLPQFQPSELAKIFVIMAIAAWYTHFQTETGLFIKEWCYRVFFWVYLYY